MTQHTKRGGKEKQKRQTLPQGNMAPRQEPEPAGKPSQAEGDRQNIEESISQKENTGQL